MKTSSIEGTDVGFLIFSLMKIASNSPFPWAFNTTAVARRLKENTRKEALLLSIFLGVLVTKDDHHLNYPVVNTCTIPVEVEAPWETNSVVAVGGTMEW